MNLDLTQPHDVVKLTLSRRNLLSLLAKLDGHPSDSECTIRRTDLGITLVEVRAEEDDVHYGERDIPPGPMHPATEEAIR